MGMIYVKRMCKKCFTDLKFMRIGEFRIPYCPKCTKPNRKRTGWQKTPEQQAVYSRLAKDKKKVQKEVWADKQTEIVTIQHHKKDYAPKQFNADGTLRDSYIKKMRLRGRVALYTEGKRWYNIEFNQGYNQAIAHAKSEIEKLVMSEEEIKKILCVACGDCTDHPADCMMVCNQSTAIRAEVLKRMEGR